MYIYIWLRAKVPRPMNLAATASSLAWGSLLRSQWWSLGWLLDALNAKNAQKGTPPGGVPFWHFSFVGSAKINKKMIGIYFAQIWHHIQRLWKQDQLRSLLVPYLHNTAELSIPNFDPYLYMYIVNVLCVFNLRIISIHAAFTKLVSQIECRRRTVMWMELTDKAMNKRHF